MVTSERDALARKATRLKDAVKQAEGQLSGLQVEQEGKACFWTHRGLKDTDG